MKIGFIVPHVGHAASPEQLRLVAVQAVDAGAHGLWVGDHFALAAQQETPYPYAGTAGPPGAQYRVPVDRRFLEAFTTLGFLSACEPGCWLGTSVAILPYRTHVQWAKLVGTISVLAGGKFRWGVGEGWLREEFDALDVSSFEDRRRWTDDVVRFVRGLWDDETAIASFHSDLADIEAMSVVPNGGEYRPAVWVGGNGPAALRRTAELGDVWHPHVRGLEPDKVAGSLRRIGELRAELAAGRPVEAVGAALFAPLKIADTIPEDPPWIAGRLDGPVEYLAEIVEGYAEAGVEELVLSIGGSARTRLDTVERLASALSAL